MKILEIYEKYQIMPQLQEHMLRVGGVAKIICENVNSHFCRISRSDERDIVTAALLHDMGNIIKFDLNITSRFFGPGYDLNFWQEVKAGYIKKYGSDEHLAHQLIGKELFLPERVLELIDCIHFDKAKATAEGGDIGKKILEYSDDRVSPFGVVSLEDRLLDLRARYESKFPGPKEEAKRFVFENALRKIETQIFSGAGIAPEYISEQPVQPLLEDLKNFVISTGKI